MELSASKVQWLELSQLSLCSEFDKENSIEFPLDSVPYIYIFWLTLTLLKVPCFPMSHFTSHASIDKKRKEKKKKRNINNDLADLPSYDRSRIHSNSFQQWLVLHILLFQREVFNKTFLGVSDGGHSLGAKVSTTSLFQWMKCMGRKTTLYYTKSVLPTSMRGSVLRE